MNLNVPFPPASMSYIQARIYQLWAYRLFNLFETVGRFKGNFLNLLNLIGTRNGYGFVIFQH